MFALWRWTDSGRLFHWVLIWHLAAVACAVIGPFGSFGRDPFLAYLLFWWLAIGTSMAVAGVVLAVSSRLADHWPEWWRDWVFGIPVFVLAYSPLLYGIMQVLKRRPEDEQSSLWLVMQMVAFVSAGMVLAKNLLRIILRLHAVSSAAPVAAETAISDKDPAPAMPLVVERLDAPVRGPLLRLSGDNHHVHVITEKGEARVLMRFADALRDVGAEDGMQIHRCHWVARRAVAGLERDGHRRWLRLTCGSRVPVARGYAGVLRARWPELVARAAEKANGEPARSAGSSSARAEGPKYGANAGSVQSSPPV